MNMYAYVGGDPINFTDPTGMMQHPIRDEISVTGQSLLGLWLLARTNNLVWMVYIDAGNISGRGEGRDTGDGGRGTGCTTTAKGGKAIVAAAAAFAREQDFLGSNTSAVFTDSFATIIANKVVRLSFRPKNPIDGYYTGNIERDIDAIEIFRNGVESGPSSIQVSTNGGSAVIFLGNLSSFEKAILVIGHEFGHSKGGYSHTISNQQKADERGWRLLKLCRGR